MLLRFLLATAVLGGCSTNEPPADAPAADSARLVGHEWRLVDLEQQPAPLGSGDRSVTLLLTATDKRASGFGGCNRYMGGYILRGDSLRFSALAMTRMGCDKGNDLETRYTGLLDTVRRFRITDRGLELLAGDSVVARYVRAS